MPRTNILYGTSPATILLTHGVLYTAGSHVVEVDSSHAVPVSHPDVVAGVSFEAVQAILRTPVGEVR